MLWGSAAVHSEDWLDFGKRSTVVHREKGLHPGPFVKRGVVAWESEKVRDATEYVGPRLGSYRLAPYLAVSEVTNAHAALHLPPRFFGAPAVVVAEPGGPWQASVDLMRIWG
eukprot:Selendium_serpulae@DN489_c0_g1_i1.p3